MLFSTCRYSVAVTLLTISLSCTTFSQDSSLKIVHVLFRHGDRSPSITFPKDIWRDHWPDGLEQLTNIGKQQQYGLGQYFRQRYGNLLSARYSSNETLVRSSDLDRTLMSAYCNLAGLYPPKGDQVWNEAIPWQPIPVHTLPVKDDYLLLGPVHCPKSDKLISIIRELPEFKAATAKLEKLSEFLSNATGDEMNTAEKIEGLHDFYHILEMHNLTLPDWVPNVMKEIEDYQSARESLLAQYPDIYKLESGPILAEMITNMENKLNGNITQKMFMYADHDGTIMRLLQLLKMYNDIDPPYIATVMVELRADSKNDASVQIFYRNTTTHEPYELTLPNCESPCPFQKFKELTVSMAPKDLKAECQDDGQP